MRQIFLKKAQVVSIIIMFTAFIGTALAHNPEEYHPPEYRHYGNEQMTDINLRDIEYYQNVNSKENVFVFEICNNSDWDHREIQHEGLNLDVTINGETHRVVFAGDIPARSCINVERSNVFDAHYVNRGTFIINAVFTYVINGQTGNLFSKEMHIDNFSDEDHRRYDPDRGYDDPDRGYDDHEEDYHDYADQNFIDVNRNSIVWDAANELYNRGIISGFSDGRFKGHLNLTRAEVAKLILLTKYGSVGYASNNGRYNDIRAGEWYEKYMINAVNEGIFNGASNMLRPGDYVSTAEFLAMISRAFDLRIASNHTYYDVPPNAWYADFAGVAYKYGFFLHRGNRLEPWKNVTRSEAVVTIYQYLRDRE